MLEFYIEGKYVDITNDVSITLNATNTDFSSPDAVKVSYSKTITLQGTTNNNSIFSHLYRLESSNVFEFDTTKRHQADILNNGILIDSGYITLDKINIKDGNYSYDVSFYSSLGDFFYNLKYNQTDNADEEKTLADLYYGFEINNQILSPEEENSQILMKWNKDYIYDSWHRLFAPGEQGFRNFSSKDILTNITAAPTYSGYYEDFDNDKVMSYNTNDVIRRNYGISSDDWNSSKQQTNNWNIFTAPRDLDENEVLDYRSLYQRPAMRLKCILDAISNPINNGGYLVEWPDEMYLDDFTNAETPLAAYYNYSWIINDRFSFDEYNADTEALISGNIIGEGLVNLKFDDSVLIDTTKYSEPRIELAMNVNLPYDIEDAKDNLYLQHKHTLSSKKVEYFTNIIEWDFEYSGEHHKYVLVDKKPKNIIDWTKLYFPTLNEDYFTDHTFIEVQFVRNTVMNRYTNSNKIFINLENIPKERQFKLTLSQKNFTSVSNREDVGSMFSEEWVVSGGKIYNWLFLSSSSKSTNVSDEGYEYGKVANTDTTFSTNSQTWLDENRESNYFSLIYDGVKSIYQNTNIDKKILFQGSRTPLDYLLNFTKLMNLRFVYEKYENKIKIMTNDEYFTGEIENIEDNIDRNGEIAITPNFWGSKVFKYQLPTKDDYLKYLYEKKTNKEFLCKMYNTNNYCLSGTNDVLNDFIFNSVSDFTQQSVYYIENNVGLLTKGNKWSWTKYKADGTENSDAWFNQNVKKYDKSPKLCLFDKDNKTITDSINFVFLNSCYVSNNTKIISDNLPVMFELGGNACFIDGNSGGQYGYESITSTTTKELYKEVEYFPNFSTYYFEDSEDYSMFYMLGDGKKHKTKYSTLITKNEYSNQYIDNSDCRDIFDLFHLGELGNYFNKENKLVEIYVKIPNHKRISDLMRKYYFFDNQIWILNSITDYDVVVPHLTKCEFIKKF